MRENFARHSLSPSFCSLQNPNNLESKALLDFDHVKNSLKVDDEGKKFVF